MGRVTFTNLDSLVGVCQNAAEAQVQVPTQEKKRVPTDKLVIVPQALSLSNWPR